MAGKTFSDLEAKVRALALVVLAVSIWALYLAGRVEVSETSTYSKMATYEEYNERALRDLNLRRIEAGLPPIKADLESGGGLQKALNARIELEGESMPPGVGYPGRENQLAAAIQQLQGLQETGQPLVGPEQNILATFMQLLNQGAPEGAKFGLEGSGGGGALDDLLDVGGSEVFNLLASLAKKNVTNGEAIQRGDVQKVGITQLIEALQKAQTRPGGTVGTERDFSVS